MKMDRALVVTVLSLLLHGQLVAAEPTREKAEEPGAVSYYRDIRPIFVQNCLGCHQPAKASGGYVMTSHEALLKKGDSDEAGILADKPEESLVLTQITSQEGKPPVMPRGKDPLPDYQVKLIKKWIEQGAEDDTPPSARLVQVDADHPPTYTLPPVITSVDYCPDGTLLAVAGYHEVLLHKADGSGLVARLVGAVGTASVVGFFARRQAVGCNGRQPRPLRRSADLERVQAQA